MTPKSLVLYLPLSGAVGGVLRDRSGSGLDGRFVGSAKLVPDHRFGAAAEFDGGGRVRVPNSPLLEFGADQDFTVALWLRPKPEQTNDQQDYTSILEIWDGGPDGYPYALRFICEGSAKGKLLASRYDQTPAEASVESTMRVDDGEYHHVAMVKRGASLEPARCSFPPRIERPTGARACTPWASAPTTPTVTVR